MPKSIIGQVEQKGSRGEKTMKKGAALVVLLILLCVGVSQAFTKETRKDTVGAETLAFKESVEPITLETVTLETVRGMEFQDIPADSPYYDTACYLTYYGIFQPAGEFHPDAAVTRAEVAAALYALSGEKGPEERRRFADVPQDSWYADAVAWADNSGIMSGISEKNFQPLVPVTRAQLAVALHRAATRIGCPVEGGADLAPFLDYDRVPGYAREALSWAVGNGLYRFCAGNWLQPRIAVSRIQMAQALVGLKSLDGDPLAAEIFAALPGRRTDSKARVNHAAIQEAVDQAAKKYHATGVQVAVIEDGAVTDTYAYGWATKGSDPMTADHKMRVASISKVVIGITAMLLREDGLIDLDQDISRYWDCTVKNPAHPNTPITIRSMLSHTSSIFNAGDDVSRAYSSVRSRLQGSGFSGSTPGSISSWAYNNYGFSVLGMTLELAGKRTVDSILNEKLYSKMDIDAAYAAGDLQDTRRLVTLYAGGSVTRSVEKQRGMHCAEKPGSNGTFFAGGLTISATDLGKLVALLAADGKYEGVQLLSPESVELMESRYPQPVPGGSYQALPLRYWPSLYGRPGVYYHTGSAYGVFNCASYDPATGDGVVVLTVGASGAKDEHGIYKVCAEISNEIYGKIA